MASDYHIPHAADDLTPEPSDRLTRPFMRFSSLASSGGIVLLLCTIVALVWSNSAAHQSYHEVFHETYLTIGVGDVTVPAEGTEHVHVEATDPETGEVARPDPGVTHPNFSPDDADGPADAAHDAGVDGGGGKSYASGTEFSVIGKSYSLHWWINDFLMAIFFLLVGLEIKREILVGELSDPKRAALPIFAAIGGMVAPALIYAGFNWGNASTISGWGIPMATDIAFAIGILALLGSRVPNSLKVFLTSLAIADDLGALMVIAIFYTDKLDMMAMGYAGAILVALLAFNAMGFRNVLWYILPGLVLWFFVYESGIHATIAGVLLAAAIPVRSRVDGARYSRYTRNALDTFEEHIEQGAGPKDITVRQRAAVLAIEKNNSLVVPLLNRMEHALHPWVAFVIIPVFALANAGVEMSGGFVESVKGPVSMGVILGLFIGKPLGVAGFGFIACKLGIASLPSGVTWRHIIGAGFLAGIGFTMAIFIANLAFKGPDAAYNLEHAKIGILVASFGASVIGLLILATAPGPKPNEPAAHTPLGKPDAPDDSKPVAKTE
ncbi:MAG: Na+/H+ antiporter NhaA [Phycisphaerales bacterium JB040]